MKNISAAPVQSFSPDWHKNPRIVWPRHGRTLRYLLPWYSNAIVGTRRRRVLFNLLSQKIDPIVDHEPIRFFPTACTLRKRCQESFPDTIKLGPPPKASLASDGWDLSFKQPGVSEYLK